MIEIEIKAKITNPKLAFEKIKKIGGEYSHTEIQRDIYFNGKSKDFKKTDEALRIREIPDGDDFINILTFKGPKLDSETKTRKEIEVTIDNKENMTDILINLGYKPSAIVNKVRRIFKYDEYTITVDKLNELGYFIEIEYVAEDTNNIDTIQQNIFDIFKKMDITEGFEKTSYLELLEKIR
ncbi:MAG: class IV adenylate cyclase [Methanosphaera sp.]|uniref:class IV adenylate cyclase n=1 Tax=Methanosphaera sp. TaxID=2666342 RepID=UPI002E7A40FA|nr:class IV adenylate cyclase [Methanosphaera sp.]MEE1117742.1 class IV adenylate cyclase [Methanosphaera sp.]MEE3324598.1 class IV adenylate cyclase [Methanosphaera sp.]